MAATQYSIVTGASSGIGEQICRFLLGIGHVVYGGSRSECSINHENFIPIELDVKSEESVISFYEQIAQDTDSVQILVNNAGICEMSSLTEMDSEVFKSHLETNVLGPFLMLKHLDEFIVQDETHIINIISTAAKHAYPNVSAYVSSKHAFDGLIESCKKEWSELGVRFSNLYPGAINTPLWDKMNAEFSREKMLTIDEFMHVFECVTLAPPMMQFPDITFLHKDGYLE